MLDLKQMNRAVIVGHKSIFEETVDALHKANLFQIEDYNEDDSGLRIGRPFENVDEVSKKLIKIRSIASMLGIKDAAAKKQDKKALLSSLDDTLEELDAELDVKAGQKSKLEAELKELDSLKKELLPFANIPVDLDYYSGYEHLSVFAGAIKEDIGSSVSKITSSYELFYDAKEGTLVLFVTAEKSGEVADLLVRSGFREYRIPGGSGVPSNLLSTYESKEADLVKKIASIDAEMDSLKDKYADFIMASNEVLSIEAQKSEAPLKVATSDSTFIIDGWVPADDFAELERVVKEATNGRAFVSKQEMTKADEKIVPIEYNNSKITSPFQQILDLYARPVYKELDPTALMFISFPLFYGMILGDIGYALILLAMALAIKKIVSSDAVKPLMNILIWCQISTMIFGVLYGEFLGFPLAAIVDHETGHIEEAGLIPGFVTHTFDLSIVGDELLTFPVHRTHLVMTMIVVTALIGFIHINIGYLLGFINENKKHGMSAAIFEKGSWFVIEIGLLLGILGYAALLPSAMTMVGVVVFVIGLIMLFKGEGIKGPVELPSLLSNSLSYTRIIAVGLSSIYIASTVNLIAFEMIWEPGTPIGATTIFAIIVFLGGHGLNTALSIMAPGLHALRLQYVEFFGKFYEGGGRKYDPFGYIKKYTEE